MKDNNIVSNLTNNEMQEFLSIKSKTWTRDSHGLFDYESNVVRENILLIQKETILYRKKHELKEVKEREVLTDEQKICDVKFNNRKFILSTDLKTQMLPTESNISDLQNKIWYIIKPENEQVNNNQNPNIQNENESFELKLNDIMKLGRIKYVITDLCLHNNLTSIEDSNSQAIFDLIHDHGEGVSNPETCCIVCLGNDSEEGCPLINICKCSVNMSVHYSCIKKWINSKLSHKKNEKETVFSYNMKSFNCSVCKTPYPLRFRHKNEIKHLIDFFKPSNKNYMVLESLNQVKDGNNYKSIHVVILEENNKIVMGRGHDADVRINDISVSRLHGTICLQSNDKIVLKDLGSKFGTLALIKEQVSIGEKKMCLQIGRSYMECKVVPISQYLLYKEELRRFEKLNNYKEKSNNIPKDANQKCQLTDLNNNFDLRGIQNAMSIEDGGLRQEDIYKLIKQKSSDTSNQNLKMNMHLGNMINNNLLSNYFTNPNDPASIDKNNKRYRYGPINNNFNTMLNEAPNNINNNNNNLKNVNINLINSNLNNYLQQIHQVQNRNNNSSTNNIHNNLNMNNIFDINFLNNPNISGSNNNINNNQAANNHINNVNNVINNLNQNSNANPSSNNTSNLRSNLDNNNNVNNHSKNK